MLVRPDSPLRLKSGFVAAADPKDTLALQQLVAAVCSLPDGALPGPGGTMLISSDSQKQGSARLVLSVAPFLNARAYGLASERCAVIMIRELSPQNLNGFDDQIRIVFDLTRSEARVATALASGRSLTEAALQAGITVKTARTYLERIFRKTGASHQGQLVALLNSAQPLHSLR
jgi:DNA-binding CsgD family transcriptional regulator